MFESDERDLEGGCEGAQDGDEENSSERNRRLEPGQSGPELARCTQCREKYRVPDAAHTAWLRTLCIQCRVAFKHVEPRSAYSVHVHIGDPTRYFVQRLKSLDYQERDWMTVKRYLSLADAMQYIYDRTGER